jgi:8-oxo-dGTP diphosphatase
VAEILEEGKGEGDVAGLKVVRAAGGVVWRRRAGALEVVLVHRPHYDDWSLPKGKVDRGEDDETCARREVEEETGLVCALGPEMPGTSYVDRRGRPKVVRYWAMTAVAGVLRGCNEVDEARWVNLDDAGARLSYARDLEVLSRLPAVIADLARAG